MVLNPALYRVLVKHFGSVKVTNEGQKRVEERVPGQSRRRVIARGEAYGVDCPICGDERQRLSISYLWLTKPPMSATRIVALANCYNENCKEVREASFVEKFLTDLSAAQMGLLDDIEVSERRISARAQKGVIPMPAGCVPLHELPDSHPAIRFMLTKYPALRTLKRVHYVSRMYGASFTETYDPLFPAAQDRIIFPITVDGQLTAWQGRTINAESRARWFLPPGFTKCFYNIDRVDRLKPVVLNEGILNAIVSGPQGICIFGKDLNTFRAEELAKHCRSVIVATDPDTFVPNNRKGGYGRISVDPLYELLCKHIPVVRKIKWPAEVLELATRHNNGEDVSVPDAADLGFKVMRKLIEEMS